MANTTRREFVLAATAAAGLGRAAMERSTMADQEQRVYGVGILGNCCTHGAGLVGAFVGHPRTRLVAGHEPDARRGPELAAAMRMELSASYEDVAADAHVDILCVATDACDKADMVELACEHGKHIYLNKPMCESLDSARRIVAAVEAADVKCVHDIPMVKALPVFARFRADMGEGLHGRPVAYHHSFGMMFPLDFPIGELWPERFDPPSLSGGGEMTNMGCYAIDYLVTLLGSPRAVQAKRQAFWQEYADSAVENFGQVICDYGDFYATLSVGKQKLGEPRASTVNALLVHFPNTNLLLDPVSDTVLVNGVRKATAEYVGDTVVEGSIDQLIRCIEEDAEPADTAEQGRMGIEALMAAYRSIVEDGAVVDLPLGDGGNPLVGGAA